MVTLSSRVLYSLNKLVIDFLVVFKVKTDLLEIFLVAVYIWNGEEGLLKPVLKIPIKAAVIIIHGLAELLELLVRS